MDESRLIGMGGWMNVYLLISKDLRVYMNGRMVAYVMMSKDLWYR